MTAKSINRIRQAQRDVIRNNTPHRVTINVTGRPQRNINLTPNDTHNDTSIKQLLNTILAATKRLITGDELSTVKNFIIDHIRCTQYGNIGECKVFIFKKTSITLYITEQ